jgi:hypothetical protein
MHTHTHCMHLPWRPHPCWGHCGRCPPWREARAAGRRAAAVAAAARRTNVAAICTHKANNRGPPHLLPNKNEFPRRVRFEGFSMSRDWSLSTRMSSTTCPAADTDPGRDHQPSRRAAAVHAAETHLWRTEVVHHPLLRVCLFQHSICDSLDGAAPLLQHGRHPGLARPTHSVSVVLGLLCTDSAACGRRTSFSWS